MEPGISIDHSKYDIDELISAKSIAARVESLAKEIGDFFENSEKLIVV
ncbi:MAG: hypoxanthine phosphoribosyltransferase, partial [Proteobacteria bacterium]|nr:hypoxanthine phosphoribosyltransferase [Pseudomonadota bacterium]